MQPLQESLSLELEIPRLIALSSRAKQTSVRARFDRTNPAIGMSLKIAQPFEQKTILGRSGDVPYENNGQSNHHAPPMS